VLAVQRALIKLGYVVKPDGELGAVTRHAIAQYQRDHGLTADAHLTPKLLHRLAAETGLSIN
jgi:peptidoglycan hydrolase-like protein with peptidoglycan-binding domain